MINRRTALKLAALVPALSPCTRVDAAVFGKAGASAKAGIAMTADGLRLRFDRFGHGAPTLVFVHGWLCDRSYWHHQVKAFSPHMAVLAPDLIGHGDSDKTRHAWSIEGLGDDVARAVLDAGAREVVLVGHSMGGPVAIEAARRMASVVRGVIMVDLHILLQHPPASATENLTPAKFRAAAAESIERTMFSDQSDPGERARIVAGMTAADPDIALALVAATGRYDIPAGLSALSCAATMIETDRGSFDPAALRRAKSDLRIAVVPGAGHFIMIEKPEVFDALLATEIELAMGRARMV